MGKTIQRKPNYKLKYNQKNLLVNVEITLDIKKNIEYNEIHSLKGNILTKLICLIYQLDYSTIYCAAISKIDPSPIHAIDFVKQRL